MAKIPWDYITSGPDSMVPNLPTPQGRELGTELARLSAAEIARAAEEYPELPKPCNECAFVAGTVPNGCLPTVANALKCAIEGDEFLCHKGTADRPCAGWLATRIAAHRSKSP